MRSNAKAASAGSIQGRGGGLSRMLRGADVPSAASLPASGSGARSRGRLSIAVLALSVFTALACAPVALAEPEFELSGAFGPDGTSSTEFSSPGAIAFDQQSDHVYVIERTGSLYKFDSEGNAVPFGGTAPYISGNKISGLTIPDTGGQVAVDSASHEFYVTDGNSIRAFQANGEPALFSAGPGTGTNLIAGFTFLAGLAVDSNGFIYASDLDADVGQVFAPSGEEVTQFSVTDPKNLAVDGSGAVYVTRAESTILKHTPSSFPVTGATTYTPSQPLPESQGTIAIAVDPATNDVYTTREFPNYKVIVYAEDGTLLTTFAGPGEEGELISSSVGIAVDGDSTHVFVSRGPGSLAPDIPKQVLIFAPIVIIEGPPSVESTSALHVTADSATLRAWVNPNTADTTYRFEYGLADCEISACTSVPLGGAEISAGDDPVLVTHPIAGLQALSTYHFRVVAENSFDPSEGPDTTFTTQSPGLGFTLADNRAWEMVSPANKHGAELLGSEFSLIQAGAEGNGLVYGSRGSVEADPEGSRSFEQTSVLARRNADGSWRSKDMTPPNADPAGLPLGSLPQHKIFTADLSRAILEPRGKTPLSPQATERTPYLAENTEPPTYLPLVTGKEGLANLPPGTVFGGDPEGSLSSIIFESATPDLEHVVFNSKVPLVEGAPNNSLYLWRGGELSLLSVLPGSEGEAMAASSELGSGSGSVRNAISDDGSRVFWSSGAYLAAGNGLGALYVRDTLAEESARLDVPQPGASGTGTSAPIFQGASTDGAVVFFTSGRQLSVDASTKGRDLYRCEIPAGPASGCASLTNVSAPLPGSGESAAVQGLISGMSEDGTRLYFVAKGVLDTEPNPLGESAEPTQPNLYLYQQGEEVRFIATLSSQDLHAWGASAFPIERTEQMSNTGSPSGRYLAFMSQHSLTGAENRDAASGEPVQQAYRYDALTDSLLCVSCNPSGAAPEGQVDDGRALVDPREQWDDSWTAAILPQPTIIRFGGNSLHQPRGMLENGRVFFNSFGSLVPADSNGQWDVYQWEPLGLGDCTSSSGGAAILRSGPGCLSLLSSGTAEEEAGFIDASQSGNDVFFFTTARLSVTDEDAELDAYDARVNGIAAKLTPRAECQGEACQPPAVPPVGFTPASSSFEGQGNVRPSRPSRCAKGKRKVRRAGKVRCVARKQSRKQQRTARAGHKRRVAR